jgi:hypothetical protein
MTNRYRCRRIWSLVIGHWTLVICLLSGCSGPDRPQLVPVSGMVTLDGQPVEGATVTFTPTGGRMAIAVTDAAGKFQLTTYDTNDGALIGEHRVTVAKIQTTGVTVDASGLSGTVDPAQIKQVHALPQAYSVAETSGLVQKVEWNMPEVKLQLKSQ